MSELRQPKYRFGQMLHYSFAVQSPTGVMHSVQCSGMVVAIEYDPRDGSTGWPFYHYTLDGNGCSTQRQVKVAESRVYEIPLGGGAS